MPAVSSSAPPLVASLPAPPVTAAPADLPLVIAPRRDALVTAAVVFVVSALGVGVLFQFARQWQIEAVRSELLQVARIAATRIDVEAHRTLRRPDQELGPRYRRVLAPLVDLLRATDDVLFLYTGVLDGDRVRFVLDTSTVYHVPGDATEPGHLMEEYSGADADFRRALVTRAPTINDEPQVDEFGYFLSAYAPLYGPDGRFEGVVGADMRVQAFEARVGRVTRITRLALVATVLLAASMGMLVYRLRVAAAEAVDRNWRMRAELAAARDAAEQSGRAKAAFLAMMSHELRTPLNAIIGYGELMHDELARRGQSRLAADMARVYGAGRHLAALISDILDFSKIEADRLVLVREPVDVAGLLADVRAELAPDATARGLALSVDADPATGVVHTDRERLRQVLRNLVGNAVKFTERGAVTVRARQAPGRPGRVVIAVHDTGPGIPADKRGRLFQPFSQVDGSLTRRAGGTGLGLVLSQRLVGAMGGTLRLRSRPGTGSTFRITVPRGDGEGRPS